MQTQAPVHERDRRLIGVLNHLIHLDLDATRAYASAIDRLSNRIAREMLTDFMRDHERHATELQQLVRDLGGKPARSADVKRLLTQGKVVLQSIRGDEGVFSAMKANEDQTNATYDDALAERDLTSQVRRVLEENLADERRHRAWILSQLEQQTA